MANQKQIEQTKKRYQYHKRIRSDTGHTIINPLDQVYDRNQMFKVAKGGHPSFHKGTKTDISTPVVPNEEQRYSVLDHKLPVSLISNSNTIQVNKYDFAPSFKQHKTVTLDSNEHYRKFKSNIKPTIESAKLTKP